MSVWWKKKDPGCNVIFGVRQLHWFSWLYENNTYFMPVNLSQTKKLYIDCTITPGKYYKANVHYDIFKYFIIINYTEVKIKIIKKIETIVGI